MQQRTFGYNPSRLPFNSLRYCTCIALIKWNSIKTFVMRLLSLLGIIRLASPGNNCFSHHLFQECPLALTFAQKWDPHQRAGTHRTCATHPGNSEGTEDQALLKTPVDKETLSFLCKQENGCLATILPRYPAYTTQGGGRRPHIFSSVPTMNSSLAQIRTYIPG